MTPPQRCVPRASTPRSCRCSTPRARCSRPMIPTPRRPSPAPPRARVARRSPSMATATTTSS
ncbi:hypothetical protein FA951_01980 [Dermacoccus nishinomiyaensis]|nr:hypothetical protein FA951_01980 [Dermacoccus nishinomiyaensis]